MNSFSFIKPLQHHDYWQVHPKSILKYNWPHLTQISFDQNNCTHQGKWNYNKVVHKNSNSYNCHVVEMSHKGFLGACN